jgi:chromosomal replication initiation ATPase DnaA
MTPAEEYEGLIRKIANENFISVETLRGRSRDRFVFEIRKVIAQELYDRGLSITRIGKYLNRDHTTILSMMGHLSRKKKK